MAIFKIEAWHPGTGQLEIGGIGINANSYDTLEQAIGYVARCNAKWRYRVLRHEGDAKVIAWEGEEYQSYPDSGPRSGQWFTTTAEAGRWIAQKHAKKDNPIKEAADAAKEENMNQPLHLKRNELILALERKVKELDEAAEATRATKAAETKQLQQALKQLDPDHIGSVLEALNECSLLRTDDEGKLQLEQHLTEPSKYVTPAERKIDRLLRALRMADDKTIEVTPEDDLWQYV